MYAVPISEFARPLDFGTGMDEVFDFDPCHNMAEADDIDLDVFAGRRCFDIREIGGRDVEIIGRGQLVFARFKVESQRRTITLIQRDNDARNSKATVYTVGTAQLEVKDGILTIKH